MGSSASRPSMEIKVKWSHTRWDRNYATQGCKSCTFDNSTGLPVFTCQCLDTKGAYHGSAINLGKSAF